MNRRGFCKSLAMVPAAAVAVSVGVPAAAVAVSVGNVKLQFPKLVPWQREALRMIRHYKAGDLIIGTHDGLYRVTSVVHDEVTAERV